MLMDELRAELPAQQLRRVVDRSGVAAYRLAQEIISVFPTEMITRLEEFPDRIQFRVARSDGFEIQKVILGRQSLERLDRDPNAARTRRTWSYPRTMSLR